MPARQATTLAQRREMLPLVEEEGYTETVVAEQVGVSFWTARKWIRRGKRHGAENPGSCYGRPTRGHLGACDLRMRDRVLRLKREHPKWGAGDVRKKLGEDSRFRVSEIPGACSIWRYWRSFGERLFSPHFENLAIGASSWGLAAGRQGINGDPGRGLGEFQSCSG